MTDNKLLKNLLKLSNIQSDINEHLPLMSIFCHLLKPKVIIELGVRAGVSTQSFLPFLNDDTKLYSYDIRKIINKSHYKNCGILERIPESTNFKNWKFKIGDSLTVHDEWENNSVDILFIDTLHKPKQIYKELTLWHKKLKPNGLILMHDVVLKKARLWEGIEKFQKENKNFKYIQCSYNNGLGILYQPTKWIESLINVEGP